jgi:hypothetical protein
MATLDPTRWPALVAEFVTLRARYGELLAKAKEVNDAFAAELDKSAYDSLRRDADAIYDRLAEKHGLHAVQQDREDAKHAAASALRTIRNAIGPAGHPFISGDRNIIDVELNVAAR